jgi:adenosylmethionine-8-amino-7-oxononanoate aminotransferase
MSASWVQQDARHAWHPYTQMRNARPPLPLVRASGAYLYTEGGRAIFDGISSWWVNLHGHSVPRINEALARQAEAFGHVMFAGFTHEPGARLAAALAARSGLPYCFFSDNGSTAVEVAMKMAYQYWRNQGAPQRTRFVAFSGAYHGDTFGAMAASATSLFHGTFADLLFTVDRAHGATCPNTGDTEPCALQCPHRLENVLERIGDHVAAVLLEPMVQGAGGMRIGHAAHLRAVDDAVRAHGTLLIADEVFTGFGRTGPLFACQHGPIQPDLMCLSKALTAGYMPLGVTLASTAIFNAFLSDDHSFTFFHGHSFTANPLACAVALESLALFDEAKCLSRVDEISHLYTECLPELADIPGVSHVRQLGAIAAFDLQHQEKGYTSPVGSHLGAACMRRGLFVRPLGNVVYFLPPYCIRDEEVKWAFSVMRDACHEVLE